MTSVAVLATALCSYIDNSRSVWDMGKAIEVTINRT